MSVDLSEFAATGEVPNPTSCWFKRLSDEQQAKVGAAREAGYPYRTIALVLATWGFKVNRRTIGDHFTGGCSCD